MRWSAFKIKKEKQELWKQDKQYKSFFTIYLMSLEIYEKKRKKDVSNTGESFKDKNNTISIFKLFNK